jgi:hypothetical protein
LNFSFILRNPAIDAKKVWFLFDWLSAFLLFSYNV